VEHLHHFGLRQDPFQNEPDLRFYFDSVSHSAPQRRIDRGLRQSKGLCVLTGEGGTGKTLLTRRLLESLEEEVFDAQLMLMMPGATEPSSVLNRYARMVGVENANSDRQALLAQIYEQLAMVREEGRHSVLMLDDAHLFNREALAEIGSLLNLEYEDRRLVSLMLVGLPKLETTINDEPSLGLRLDVRTRIEALDEQNTMKYLQHRLVCAEGDASMLPPDAMMSLSKYGQGRPRLLNTLTDNALYEAYLAGRTELACQDVERAAADLGIGIGSMPSAVPVAGFEATSQVAVAAGVAAPIEPLFAAPMETSVAAPIASPADQCSLGMTMELDEVAMPELESPFEAPELEVDFGDSSAMELNDFLGEESIPSPGLTNVMPLDSLEAVPLDDAMADLFSTDASEEPFQKFDAEAPTASPVDKATRVAFDDVILEAPFVEELEIETTLTAESLDDGLDDQLDDLFVELIEE
jgi:type II secretory pathway predicted ATPase ExeA